MEITKNSLIDIIKQIDDGVEKLLTQCAKQEQEIKELKLQNETLKKNNQVTLDRIKEYIEELEQIKSHYVNSNNNSN